MQSGKFITIEGGEGAGKSTNISFIKKNLEQYGFEVVLTREPGGTPLSERLRKMLLDKNETKMSSDTELLLMFAARSQHLTEVILPAIQQGKWVVCDRFTDATYAYQGGGRGIAFERIAVLEDWVQGGMRPDMTIIFDLPIDVGLSRAGSRSEPDRFEQEDIDFFMRVRNAYLERANKNPKRYAIVDAEPELHIVQQNLVQILDRLVNQS